MNYSNTRVFRSDNKSLSLPVKLLIGGGIVLVILMLAGVVWRVREKKKHYKKN